MNKQKSQIRAKTEKHNKYLELWRKLEVLFRDNGYIKQTQNKNKPELNFTAFAKAWEKHHDTTDANDYKKVAGDLRKNYKNRIEHEPQEGTVNKIKSYIKFLDDDYFEQELLNDEDILGWFDD